MVLFWFPIGVSYLVCAHLLVSILAARYSVDWQLPIPSQPLHMIFSASQKGLLNYSNAPKASFSEELSVLLTNTTTEIIIAFQQEEK